MVFIISFFCLIHVHLTVFISNIFRSSLPIQSYLTGKLISQRGCWNRSGKCSCH